MGDLGRDPIVTDHPWPHCSSRRCLVGLLLTGCGGDDSADEPVRRGRARGRRGGVRHQRSPLLNSTCAGITVQDNPTTVEQEAGSDTIELTHAGTTYTGRAGRRRAVHDGRRTASRSDAATHSLTVHGTFSGAGFRASVLATVTGGADGPCGYEVAWVGAAAQKRTCE